MGSRLDAISHIYLWSPLPHPNWTPKATLRKRLNALETLSGAPKRQPSKKDCLEGRGFTASGTKATPPNLTGAE